MIKLLVIGKFDASDAAKPVVESFARLQNHEVQILVMCDRPGWATDYLTEHGVQLIHAHPKKKVDQKFIEYLGKYLDDQQPDILYLLNSKSIANGIKAAKGRNVKVITYRGAMGLHWYDPFAYLGHLHPRVDKVLCLTEAISRNVESQLPRMRGKTYVIPHGYDPDWYDNTEPASLSEFDIPDEAFVIGCVANNRPVKGIRYLIRSMKYLKESNIFLLLIGRDMASELKKEIDRLPHPERIIAPGFVSAPRPIYKAINVYVQPSVKEGFGKSIAEVMCLARPIVATKSGGPEALIEDGKSGLLVPIKNPKAIAEAVLKIYHDDKLDDQFGQAAQERIRTNFSIEGTVSKYLSLFRELTS